MPDDWVHCLFAGSIIGVDYETRHCWVHQLLDSPARFLGGHHRILLHDLETAKKLGTRCWWAGFAAALHIDLDNVSGQIRSHLDNVVRRIKNREGIDEVEMKRNAEEAASTYLRNMFLKVHKKVGISILADDKTSKEVFISIEPNTLLRTTWDYVNQFPLKGLHVNGRPYNELPSTEPRIIPHPNTAETLRTPPHVGECLDRDLLKHLFSNV